jgi:hypothetical protein
VSGGRRRLLYEVSAPVRATVEQLRALIDSDWLITELGWTAASFANGSLERAPGLLAGQGGWWYRGEYTAEEVGGRVRLVHRVFNVAPQGRWAPALANRLFIGYRAGLQRRVDDVARKVDLAVAS